MSILDAGSKLLFHSDRLHELFTTGKTNPVHLTVGLTNYCNHRCMWCYIDFIREGRKKIDADLGKMLDALRTAREMGAKAVTIVGDGEPTLYPLFPQFVSSVKALGFDLGVFTNGGWRKGGITETLQKGMSFVRFSVDAATPEIHKLIHGSTDFELVLENINELVVGRKCGRLPVIGVQFAMNHLNWSDAVPAARLFRKIGVDYLSFKPVYKNSLNISHEENSLPRETLQAVLRQAKDLETESFQVLWKEWQMEAILSGPYARRPYDTCKAIWLSPYIDEDGTVEFCGNLKGRGFSIGNICQTPFPEIWGGEKHLEAIARLDLERCPHGCKLHGLNLKLHAIQHPSPEDHVNFI